MAESVVPRSQTDPPHCDRGTTSSCAPPRMYWSAVRSSVIGIAADSGEAHQKAPRDSQKAITELMNMTIVAENCPSSAK